MTGRSDRDERHAVPPPIKFANRRESRAGRPQRRLVGISPRIRVGIEDATAAQAHGLELVEIGGRVDAHEVLARCGCPLDGDEVGAESKIGDALHDRDDPTTVLGVHGSGVVVVDTNRSGDDQRHVASRL